MKAGRRTSLAFALSLILFLPVAYAANTITLTSPNAQASGLFGAAAGVIEDRAVVVGGAFGESAGGRGNLPSRGPAYVVDTSAGLITTLASPDQAAGGEFGFSVAVSGTTVVVGAPGEQA